MENWFSKGCMLAGGQVGINILFPVHNSAAV